MPTLTRPQLIEALQAALRRESPGAWQAQAPQGPVSR